MQIIVCPICRTPININTSLSAPKCVKGHSFVLRDGILDLLSVTSDENILEEEKHWDQFATRGRLSIAPNSFMQEKVFEDYRLTFQNLVSSEWPDFSYKTLSIADIACGYGSAIRYLGDLDFAGVDYVGIDVSSKFMLMYDIILNRELPKSWRVQFIRASANKSIFKDSSLDIVFQHHLCIIWMSMQLFSGFQKP